MRVQQGWDMKPVNLERICFVYVKVTEPHATRVVWYSEPCDLGSNPDWIHTCTIDPALFLQHLANETTDGREEMLRSLRMCDA